MGNDDTLVARVRALFACRKGTAEKRMFGGVSFLFNRHLCVGVRKGELIVRLGVGQEAESLGLPGVRPFDITGRPMRGWVMIDQSVLNDDEVLAEWVEKGIRLCRTLPPKRIL